MGGGGWGGGGVGGATTPETLRSRYLSRHATLRGEKRCVTTQRLRRRLDRRLTLSGKWS